MPVAEEDGPRQSSYLARRSPERSINNLVIGNAGWIVSGGNKWPVTSPLLVTDSFQSIEFANRTRMIIHPQVQDRPLIISHDDQSRGLPAPAVASSCLCSLHRGDEASCEGQRRMFAVRLERIVYHPRSCQDVACDGKSVSHCMARPREALLAGMDRHAAAGIDNLYLAVRPTNVVARQHV